MEVRQLEAFVAVATELHFGRAADRLYVSQPTVSELVRRLERELGAPLFDRTTRRVTLTDAGAELLNRSKVILDEIAAARAAVARIAGGDDGVVRLGITPPVAPVLAPHLRQLIAEAHPGMIIDISQMWLPAAQSALIDGQVDVIMTCGLVDGPSGAVSEVFCGEPLFVGLRPDHRYAPRDQVTLADLAHDVLGSTQPGLFPAWALCQQQALAAARVRPPTVELTGTDLSASRWAEQREIDWIMLIGSLTAAHNTTVIKAVAPETIVPFTVQWNPHRGTTTVVARFIERVLDADLPAGWRTMPGHLRHVAGATGT